MTSPTTARWTPPPNTLIGMVHVAALPGAPRSSQSVRAIAAQAAAEAKILDAAGFHAILIENMHDAPYLRAQVGPEITAAMTACALAVRDAVPDLPLGIQILAGANRAALAVALAAHAHFIRAENFVFATIADEGLTPEADAAPLLRYRRAVSADHISVFADIKKKHSAHAITADVSLAETARAAHFFDADALIVTGTSTGQPPATTDLQEASNATPLPVIAGSGVTQESIRQTLSACSAAIVGTAIKHDANWRNPIDPDRAEAIVRAATS